MVSYIEKIINNKNQYEYLFKAVRYNGELYEVIIFKLNYLAFPFFLHLRVSHYDKSVEIQFYGYSKKKWVKRVLFVSLPVYYEGNKMVL